MASVLTPNHRHRVREFFSWLRHHPAAIYAAAGLGLIVAAILVTITLLWQDPTKAPVVAATQLPKEKQLYHSPLTGELVDSEADTRKPVTGVLIENTPSARPQSGLRDAEVVYEAIAEGGITRFLALYQQNKPNLLGPVRSLRPYYLDWATPYDATIVHVGGSAQALKTVRSGTYRDADQMFNSTTFWRAKERYAPHNVYTSFKNLDALNEKKGYKSSTPKVAKRDDEPTAWTTPATSIQMTISSAIYNPSYTYDPATKRYTRSQNGAHHVDREAGAISARVVIALETTMRQVLEDGYRESITTTGSGKAYIFTDGKMTEARWQKETAASPLLFFDANNQQIALAPGTTWISAIPTDRGEVTWK